MDYCPNCGQPNYYLLKLYNKLDDLVEDSQNYMNDFPGTMNDLVQDPQWQMLQKAIRDIQNEIAALIGVRDSRGAISWSKFWKYKNENFGEQRVPLRTFRSSYYTN